MEGVVSSERLLDPLALDSGVKSAEEVIEGDKTPLQEGVTLVEVLRLAFAVMEGGREKEMEVVMELVGEIEPVGGSQYAEPGIEVMPMGQGMHVAFEEAPNAELLVPEGQRVALIEFRGQYLPWGQIMGRPEKQ